MVCWLVKEDKDIVVIYALLKSTILAQVFFFFFFLIIRRVRLLRFDRRSNYLSWYHGGRK